MAILILQLELVQFLRRSNKEKTLPDQKWIDALENINLAQIWLKIFLDYFLQHSKYAYELSRRKSTFEQ